MKLLLVTEVWKPYVSGLVRTYATTVDHLERWGHEVQVISPDQFWTVPFPLYPQFRIPLGVTRKVFRLIEASRPDAIHLAAEGPLGMAARRWCLRHGMPFTTSFTTKLPEYLNAWCGLPVYWGYHWIRWFHRPSSAVMVSTESVRRELAARGFRNLACWTRGVDLELFRPGDRDFLTDDRPISLYVGRVSKEKNLAAFLDLDLPGTKYVLGDGPWLPWLRKRYPHVRFPGVKHGDELTRYYGAADVFVFPSRTDTFGLVLLEALACGTPVAAYPVTGPIDVLGNTDAGALDEDLGRAVHRALTIPRVKCREFARQFSWDVSVQQFLNNLHPLPASSKPLRDQTARRVA
jgi:glycosyltransferase involved in cell wall biosynthesis